MKSTTNSGVFLGLGSNLGDRSANIAAAVHAVEQLPGTAVLRCSRVYETEPWGVSGQDVYLNCAIEITTTLRPTVLLDRLKNIERSLGRTDGPRYAPRVIDIDILLYGEEVHETDTLTIPHPMLALRRFVLEPLAEIAGDVRHPLTGNDIAELARQCGDTGSVEDTGIVPCG